MNKKWERFGGNKITKDNKNKWLEAWCLERLDGRIVDKNSDN